MNKTIYKDFQNLNFLMKNKFIKKFIMSMIYFLQFHLALNIMRGFRTIITKMYALYVNYIQTKK